MLISIGLLVFGFILLIKGADIFVDGASSTAQNFKISKVVIGLTIVAFGTSAPELAVSLQSLASNSTDMVLGNVIGSCILNILLIVGVAAIIRPIKMKSNTIQKELPITMLVSALLAVLFLDVNINGDDTNLITRSDAIAILLFFCVFLYYLFSLVRNKKETKESKPKFKLGKSLVFVAIGLAGIIIGSDLVVNSATDIATGLGISERIIALTVIALGTSLPEFVTTIVSSLRGEQDLVVGNIIGSNIFNICIVLGVPVAIYGSISPTSFNMLDLVMFLISAIVLYIFAKTKHTIGRIEGAIMVITFVGYYVALFMM